MLVAPRRTWRAWMFGRSTRNLYATPDYDASLELTVDALKEKLGTTQPVRPARAIDVARFIAFAGAGAVVGSLMFVALVPVSIAAAVARFLRRTPRAA